VGALLVYSGNEETDTERPLRGVACLGLTLLGQLVDHSLNGMLAVVSVPVVQRFLPHESINIPSVCGKATESYAKVVITVEDLLLVRSEVIG